ncbi:MAG: hypothetical protein SGPRY_007780, partial [Prymnesium sp.]
MALRAVLQAAAEVGRRCEQLRAEWEGREGALAHEAAGLEARMLSQAVCFERRRDRFRAENARLRKENRELREERERWERECARLKDDFLSLQAGYTSLLHACEAKLISLRSCREEDCEYTANIEGDSEYTRSIEEGADHSSS